MVKWLRLHLPMQGIRVQSPVGELGSHMPNGQKKKQNMNNRNNIVTNSIKTLKMVHIYQSINITVLNKARICL